MELEKWFSRVKLKYQELHGEDSISRHFLLFMQSEIKDYFKTHLGLDPAEMKGKMMVSSIMRPFSPSDGDNVIHMLLAIQQYGIEIGFHWQSREGDKTVLPADEDFDAAQLKTRVEGIDATVVREYLGIKPPLKQYFSALDINYPLEVDQFNADLVFLVIKSQDPAHLKKIGEALNDLVQHWNEFEESGHDGPGRGRFHSTGVERIDSGSLYYKMDLGTTNENGLKYILEELNHHKIDTVRITSFP